MVNGGYIDTRETHSGAVIMIGDHAFKPRRVDLGFLDFRDPVQRRLVCRRELELNRGSPRTSSSASASCRHPGCRRSRW